MDRRRRFIVSIAMLITGMSVGFLLLGTVYDGPRWVAFLVFVAYLAITALVIRFSSRYARSLKNEEKR